MIVSFANVKPVQRSQATPIYAGSPAMGPTTVAGRPTLYDPLWGYFLFSQSVACEYRDTNTYHDVATFTIQGVFTRSATMGHESLAAAEYAAEDEAGFTALVAKYDALEAMFIAAGKSTAPAVLSTWGTASDTRCIKLPLPLVDKDNNPVYGLPQSLRIEKTQFPVEIRYEAVLREAKPPPAKLMINDIMVDNGVVDITIPQPEFAHHTMVGGSGEVLQLLHYKAMEVGVSGSLPLVMAEQAISDTMKRLAASLEEGKLTISLSKYDSTGSPIWEDLDVVDDPTVETDYANGVMSVSAKARE